MKPYTYLIGWKKHQKYYYGVRWANKSSPENDLWKEYFTSSKYVHEFAQKNGDPDIIQIDMIFDNPEEAIEKEKTVLREVLHSKERDKWLNVSDGFTFVMSEEIKELLRQKTLEQFADSKKRELHKKSCKPHSDKIWINDGERNKRVNEKIFLEKYQGWKRGRLFKDKPFWNYDKSGENNPFYGKKHSQKTKKKISETKRKNGS